MIDKISTHNLLHLLQIIIKLRILCYNCESKLRSVFQLQHLASCLNLSLGASSEIAASTSSKAPHAVRTSPNFSTCLYPQRPHDYINIAGIALIFFWFYLNEWFQKKISHRICAKIPIWTFYPKQTCLIYIKLVYDKLSDQWHVSVPPCHQNSDGW